jgi:comEA protein
MMRQYRPRRLYGISVMTMMGLVFAVGTMTIAAQEPRMPQTATAAAPPTSAPINLNTATAAQLETLPGIGKATAERILEYRQKNGAFRKVEDLMNVRGIGEKSFLQLKALVVVTTPKAP